MALKPEISLGLAAATATLVWGIFQSHMPSTADTRANKNTASVESTRKAATIECLVVVSGISLLAKDPTVFIVGGTMTMMESFIRMHASYVNPATNKVAPATVPGAPASETGAAPATS
jgi:hypothetical protein